MTKPFHQFLILLATLVALPAMQAAKVLPVLNNPIVEYSLYGAQTTASIDLDTVFGVEEIDDQAVRFTSQFSIGDEPIIIDLALFSNRTPLTRANFLDYVNSGAYDNQIIHRTVPGFVAQGGGFYAKVENNAFTLEPIPTNPPVQNEFGISNTVWTVSMAKSDLGPDSATSQWFISLGENSANLDNQNGGFTVFARVLQSTHVDTNQLASTGNFPIYDFGGSFTNIPLNGYDGESVAFNNLNLFTTATLVPVAEADAGEDTGLSYEVTINSNPALATLTIEDNELKITRAADSFGSATIELTATDSVGNEVYSTFVLKALYDFNYWRAANFSPADQTNDAISGPDADPNEDGVTNLELFAADETPEENQQPQVMNEFIVNINTGKIVPNFIFPFRNDIGGVTYEIQYSPDLGVDTPWAIIPHTVVDTQTNGNIDTITLQPDATDVNPDHSFYRRVLNYDPNPAP